MVLVAVGATLVAVTEGAPVAWWVAGAVAAAAVVGSFFDVWAGALVGLLVAVVVVAGRRWADLWQPDVFIQAGLETLALIVVGAAAGNAGRAMRHREATAHGSSAFEPVHGSLGLLGQQTAFARLEEDLARGERLMRPVTLALFDVVVTDDALSPAGREAAQRAVARVVESRAGEHDMPFALASDRLGIAFPEATVGGVWDVVGRVLESVGTATFAFGAERSARSLSQAVTVLVGISRQGPDRATPATLVDHAVAALDRARAEELAS